jgi:hypothetical protein
MQLMDNDKNKNTANSSQRVQSILQNRFQRLQVIDLVAPTTSNRNVTTKFGSRIISIREIHSSAVLILPCMNLFSIDGGAAPFQTKYSTTAERTAAHIKIDEEYTKEEKSKITHLIMLDLEPYRLENAYQPMFNTYYSSSS